MFNCPHSPQCTSRGPHPPPHGPRTFTQLELDEELVRNEAIQSFTNNLLEFLEEAPGETLDDTVAKLEAIKNMLEPEKDDTKESEFDKIIAEVKITKEAIEKINNEQHEYDEDYFKDIEDDLPRHYWGGEDAIANSFL